MQLAWLDLFLFMNVRKEQWHSSAFSDVLSTSSQLDQNECPHSLTHMLYYQADTLWL